MKCGGFEMRHSANERCRTDLLPRSDYDLSVEMLQKEVLRCKSFFPFFRDFFV